MTEVAWNFVRAIDSPKYTYDQKVKALEAIAPGISQEDIEYYIGPRPTQRLLPGYGVEDIEGDFDYYAAKHAGLISSTEQGSNLGIDWNTMNRSRLFNLENLTGAEMTKKVIDYALENNKAIIKPLDAIDKKNYASEDVWDAIQNYSTEN